MVAIISLLILFVAVSYVSAHGSLFQLSLNGLKTFTGAIPGNEQKNADSIIRQMCDASPEQSDRIRPNPAEESEERGSMGYRRHRRPECQASLSLSTRPPTRSTLLNSRLPAAPSSHSQTRFKSPHSSSAPIVHTPRAGYSLLCDDERVAAGQRWCLAGYARMTPGRGGREDRPARQTKALRTEGVDELQPTLAALRSRYVSSGWMVPSNERHLQPKRQESFRASQSSRKMTGTALNRHLPNAVPPPTRRRTHGQEKSVGGNDADSIDADSISPGGVRTGQRVDAKGESKEESPFHDYSDYLQYPLLPTSGTTLGTVVHDEIDLIFSRSLYARTAEPQCKLFRTSSLGNVSLSVGRKYIIYIFGKRRGEIIVLEEEMNGNHCALVGVRGASGHKPLPQRAYIDLINPFHELQPPINEHA
ncbi:hypothetical protein DFP72DRAFT_1055769 [Ephemerocybe angulata]|uniref:Uncharacterized protein n=1 Tax=Ephemerocybe angulata TaxID=980116 RepID=A0A8H6LRK4_9AGAR|nr:hypothetical protein DFP72DRAFT_1055769 [Tulosesus angulatus]